ncbi:MAG: 3-phosphoshikimate 1-carboxyvinyltransferase [Oscillospiraceae bacterium]|nr:3-phosphoshikimate 1-carboxyvinyltransferase [Oscillospiraceae bacterium]
MRVTVMPGPIKGVVEAIPSKSHLHRLLICAALADTQTCILCKKTDAEDINATIRCLRALGAEIVWGGRGLNVTPIDHDRLPENAALPCGESGSTLRFMLPVIAALGVAARFEMAGRLPERPLAPLDAELTRQGVHLTRPEPNILLCEGQLRPGDFTLPGDISSQYITGLLLALPLLKSWSILNVIGPVESNDYIEMTLEAMAAFKITPTKTDNAYEISERATFLSPGEIICEGDWSNAAFWLCAGCMPGGEIEMRGLSRNSRQGDREIVEILARMGADIRWKGDVLHVKEGRRLGRQIDARAIPDLAPVLSAVACAGQGETQILNAARLRLKESDRLAATAQVLNALGGQIVEQPDSLKIQGKSALSGGEIDSWGDHRIAMTAAIASAACTRPVTITGGQAVNKSYPAFWDDLAALGKQLTIEG